MRRPRTTPLARGKKRSASDSINRQPDHTKILKATRSPWHAPEDVEQAMQALREFHRVGQESLMKHPRNETYPSTQLQQDADAYGYGPEKLRKARAFADDAGFTPAELDALIATCQKYGYAMGVTCIYRILSVHPKKERARFIQNIAKHGWSHAVVGRAIIQRYGARRASGRHHHVAQDRAGALVELEKLCEGWRRWGRALERAAQNADSGGEHLLPATVLTAFQKASARIGDLHTAVQDELDKQAEGRKRREDVERSQTTAGRT